MSMTPIEKIASEVEDKLAPPIEAAKVRLENTNDQITAFIKNHAGACLLGAVALGYIVARVARRAS